MNELSLFCMIVCFLILTGCAQSHRPKVYHGGQYYGDAVHAPQLNGH